MQDKPKYWEYIEWYPEADEDGYDGVHDGGIKGLRDDAPKEAIKEYKQYLSDVKKGIIT